MRLTKRLQALLGSATLLLGSIAHAGALDALKDFVANTKTGKTTFTQRIVKSDGRISQTASGIFEVARPGKFRWSYTKPYEQELVGDGVTLWIYDKDLNQVTSKKLGDALGASPAAILSGAGDLEKNFTLKESASLPTSPSASPSKPMEWVEAIPKGKDTGFDIVRLGFVKADAAGAQSAQSAQYVLAAMELKDSFGQVSVLNFGEFQRNPVFAEGTFVFVAPKGADVLKQ